MNWMKDDDQMRKANFPSIKRKRGLRRSIKTEYPNGGGGGGGSSGCRRKSCWPSLSDDILRTIMHKLCFSDQIRAAATCRGWRIRIPRRTTDLHNHLPWLIHQICYDQAAWTARRQVVLKTTLYEPGNPNPRGPIRTAIDDFPTEGFAEIEPWYRPRILESKLGWLLVEIMDLENHRKPSCLVLYTPFGNNTCTKPHVLPGGSFYEERVIVATFSSPPTSQDCIVFLFVKVLKKAESMNEIRVWRVKQGRWTTYPITLNVGPHLTRRITSTAHVNGTLYSCFESGLVHAFDTSNGGYELVWPELDHNNIATYYKVLVESNGELLLLLFKLESHDRNFGIYKKVGRGVYGYDVSANTWVRKQRLCDRVVFVSSYWHAMLVPVPATQMLTSCGKAYAEPVKDDMIHGYGSLLDHNNDSGLCCVFATHQHNTGGGGKDYVWLSYPFF